MVQVNQVLHHYLDSAFLFSPCVSRLSQSRFDTGSCSPKQQLFLPCFFLSLAFVVIQTVYATYTRIGIRHGVSIVPVHNEGVYVASRLTLFFLSLPSQRSLVVVDGKSAVAITITTHRKQGKERKERNDQPNRLEEEGHSHCTLTFPSTTMMNDNSIGLLRRNSRNSSRNICRSDESLPDMFAMFVWGSPPEEDHLNHHHHHHDSKKDSGKHLDTRQRTRRQRRGRHGAGRKRRDNRFHTQRHHRNPLEDLLEKDREERLEEEKRHPHDTDIDDDTDWMTLDNTVSSQSQQGRLSTFHSDNGHHRREKHRDNDYSKDKEPRKSRRSRSPLQQRVDEAREMLLHSTVDEEQQQKQQQPRQLGGDMDTTMRQSNVSDDGLVSTNKNAIMLHKLLDKGHRHGHAKKSTHHHTRLRSHLVNNNNNDNNDNNDNDDDDDWMTVADSTVTSNSRTPSPPRRRIVMTHSMRKVLSGDVESDLDSFFDDDDDDDDNTMVDTVSDDKTATTKSTHKKKSKSSHSTKKKKKKKKTKRSSSSSHKKQHSSPSSSSVKTSSSKKSRTTTLSKKPHNDSDGSHSEYNNDNHHDHDEDGFEDYYDDKGNTTATVATTDDEQYYCHDHVWDDSGTAMTTTTTTTKEKTGMKKKKHKSSEKTKTKRGSSSHNDDDDTGNGVGTATKTIKLSRRSSALAASIRSSTSSGRHRRSSSVLMHRLSRRLSGLTGSASPYDGETTETKTKTHKKKRNKSKTRKHKSHGTERSHKE